MKTVEIAPGIFWVGAVDWNVRNFHGHTYTTERGTTYNAYLIVDDKITLVDTVHAPFAGEMMERISAIVPPDKISYVVANHVEKDHSGALPVVMEAAKGARIFGTAKCGEGLSLYYRTEWDFHTVKTGDELSLGGKTLQFIEAPMLHWPDSMFTYVKEEALLMSNDAFGQHLASSARFDDGVDRAVLMSEAAKYYANILWGLSAPVGKKIDEVAKSGMPVKAIAPSHGIIWRQSPSEIIKSYVNWAGNASRPKAVIAYETMWGSTEKMARAILEGLSEASVTAQLYDINATDRSDIMTEMLDSRAFILGSSTHDNGMLPNMAGFLHMLKGAKPKNRLCAAFGSYGWAGGAVREIEDMFKECALAMPLGSVSVKYAPGPDDLEACRRLGRELGHKLTKGGNNGQI
ncbi:MAG: flavodoxin domain-containing protein [Candidatus Omnitrophota bacterium]